MVSPPKAETETDFDDYDPLVDIGIRQDSTSTSSIAANTSQQKTDSKSPTNTHTAALYRNQRNLKKSLQLLQEQEANALVIYKEAQEALISSGALASQYSRGWFYTNKLDWLRNRSLGKMIKCLVFDTSSSKVLMIVNRYQPTRCWSGCRC